MSKLHFYYNITFFDILKGYENREAVKKKLGIHVWDQRLCIVSWRRYLVYDYDLSPG